MKSKKSRDAGVKSGKMPPKATPAEDDRARMARDYLKGIEKRGELDPEHRPEFERLLGDVVQPTTEKKK